MKMLFLITAFVIFTMYNISAQSYAPSDYVPLAIGNYWKYETVHDTSNSSNDRWSAIEVVDSTIFGIPGETLSYKVEYSEWFTGQDTNIYRTVYHSFNSNGDLGYTAHLFDGNLTIYDSLIVFLKNPITVGDSTYYSFGGFEVYYTVVSINDTLNLPIGYFEDCIQIHEYSTLNSIPNEDKYGYCIPISYLPTAAGQGSSNRIHWYVYPDSFIYGYSNLVQCNVQPMVYLEKSPISALSNFSLQQNYPNPFNTKTTIEFSIPKTKFVSLKIYNLLGQEVTTLVSENLKAGNYKYDWDAGGFSSGIYIYRLETEIGLVQSRKLILLK